MQKGDRYFKSLLIFGYLFIYLFYNYVFSQRGRPPGPARKNDAKKKKTTNDKSKDAVDDDVVCKGKCKAI